MARMLWRAPAIRRIPAEDRCFYVSLLAIPAIVMLWLLWPHPPIGMYVAVLGVGAVIATVRVGMNRKEKAIWVAAAFALAVLEIRTLYRREAQQEAEQLKAQEQLQTNFSRILDSQRTVFEATLRESQRQFTENDKIHTAGR
jgi:hypothetical protein